jgi:hypothetical protein
MGHELLLIGSLTYILIIVFFFQLGTIVIAYSIGGTFSVI